MSICKEYDRLATHIYEKIIFSLKKKYSWKETIIPHN